MSIKCFCKEDEMSKMKAIYDIKQCIKDLEIGEIKSYSGIPQEYHNVYEIVTLTRKLGLRKIIKKGFDVISQNFFVEEIIYKQNYEGMFIGEDVINTFDEFSLYYDFLQGDIYENACYFQCKFADETINKYNLDLNKISMIPVSSNTIDDCLPMQSENELEEYNRIECQISTRKKWIKKYNACSTYKELIEVDKKHRNSKDDTDNSFYFWNYVNYHGRKSFKVIMQLVCNDYSGHEFENALCFLYDKNKVLKEYDYMLGEKRTQKKHNQKIKEIFKMINECEITSKTCGFFDKKTHYYCVRTSIYLSDSSNTLRITNLYRYFETFEMFADFLDNNLTNCDLKNALYLKIDFSKYKIDETTKLPVCCYNNLKKVIYKKYNRIDKKFHVVVKWLNENDFEVFRETLSYKYFFEFVAFLKNDLSNSDLLFCEGLNNLLDFSVFDFTNAKLRSSIFEKIGIPYTNSEYLNNQIDVFGNVEENEKETTLVLKNERLCDESDVIESKIYYITDLHLLHRIYNAKCKTNDDCFFVIQKLIDNLLKDLPCNSELIIAGDISSDFLLFEFFVRLLRKSIDEQYKNINVIFTLGNHELWAFSQKEFSDIVRMYRELLFENKMHLIQNEILYIKDYNVISTITQEELNCYSSDNLREMLRDARLIFLGGIGFSGYNNSFNANNGIYKEVLHRKQEVVESKVFENLYDKVCQELPDKTVIVVTHMPFEDWHKDKTLKKNFVYVSGHNHRNTFYDDGEIRSYADNQIGYHCESSKAKYFYIDKSYDWFSDYKDGIHIITRDDYINFYRGKNLTLTCNRDFNKLYMLKKNNYYCFIHQNTSGGLTMLNGGSLKSLPNKDIQYYYDNMDIEISLIKTPLDKFQKIQEQISKEIKKFGGSGYIHGAIVDIDFYNHIYVNPNDLTITPYFAWDTILKYTYPSVSSLLEANAPLLFSNYNKLLTENRLNIITGVKTNTDLTVKPILHMNTDIYAASREIKKMQKLNSNILSTWYDNIPGTKLLTPENSSIKKITKTTTNSNHVSYIGKSNIMNCGLKATVIEDFGYKDITVEFEDGLIRKHRRRDHFNLGKIAHCED